MKVHFMHPVLRQEFDQLPSSVRSTFNNIVSSLKGPGGVYVSSVLSNQRGIKRTHLNGPNHADHKAVDFVVTPFSDPTYRDQEGNPRSPQFHWNPELINHLARLFDEGLISCLVYIEPDHIHLDSNHPAGVRVYNGGKACYSNSKMRGHTGASTIR